MNSTFFLRNCYRETFYCCRYKKRQKLMPNLTFVTGSDISHHLCCLAMPIFYYMSRVFQSPYSFKKNLIGNNKVGENIALKV